MNFAYKDQAFPIGSGQTISQPYTVAFQTELLDPQPYEKILEVGTGSGYQTCLLLYLESDVYSIERQKKLWDQKIFRQSDTCSQYETWWSSNIYTVSSSHRNFFLAWVMITWQMK